MTTIQNAATSHQAESADAADKKIELSGPGLRLTFVHKGNRLWLEQIQRHDDMPLLFADYQLNEPGAGPVGNPLTLVIRNAPHAGIYAADSFYIQNLEHDHSTLKAHLRHDTLPIQFMMVVSVEGHTATWRGQLAWDGDTPLDAEIYFPIFSRIRMGDGESDRMITTRISGSTISNLKRNAVRTNYFGNCSSPCFLVEGGGRGLAFLDDNRADLAPHPGACVKRSYLAGNITFQTETTGQNAPLPGMPGDASVPADCVQGPVVGICHARYFRPSQELGYTESDLKSESHNISESTPLYRGDVADLGPVVMYAYQGTWRDGAAWLREKRQHVPLRVSPADWYRRTTFISETMGDTMARNGQSFHHYADILRQKRLSGSDFFHLPGFHDPEVLGTTANWLNRGDYFFASQDMGGFDAARQGIEAVHRAGGHVLYYVEGLIMWKRSRIGRHAGRQWALMHEDGSFIEHYRGFWHMCPACEEWQNWLARTCADIVRTTGVDGFFLDSSCATNNHRCFNPAHRHPHPDIWNWGLRNLLKRVRQEVDKVNPETILFVEGAGDMAREFVDGFVAHSHDWLRRTLTVPIVRYLHPDMRVFESWGGSATPKDAKPEPQKFHLWNAVHGQRIYAHDPQMEVMTQNASHTRRYYDMYPEICDAPMSQMKIRTHECMAELFESSPRVITIGNATDHSVQATVELPVAAGALYDRLTGQRIGVIDRKAKIALEPWDFRTYEIHA